MAEVAGFVVGDGLFGCVEGVRRGDADLGEPFVDVLKLAVPQFGAVTVGIIVLQKLGVMLEVRTATSRVCNDGVKLLRRKLVELFASEFLGIFPIRRCVRGGGHPAKLFGRGDDFATVGSEHFYGVAVDIAEDDVPARNR